MVVSGEYPMRAISPGRKPCKSNPVAFSDPHRDSAQTLFYHRRYPGTLYRVFTTFVGYAHRMTAHARTRCTNAVRTAISTHKRPEKPAIKYAVPRIHYNKFTDRYITIRARGKASMKKWRGCDGHFSGFNFQVSPR